jgi:hypothetical protein
LSLLNTPKWMTSISPAFPNVTSLCITPELLPAASKFASLRSLTLTRFYYTRPTPGDVSICMSFPPNRT